MPRPAPSAVPEAHLHDALQVPAFHDARAREAEALRRIGYWHGAGEWQAALLTLGVPHDAAADGMAWRAWQAATKDLHVAVAVRGEIAALRPHARRDVQALLIERAAAWPLPLRQRVWREWRSRWQTMLGIEPRLDSALSRWRTLVAHHRLFAAAAAAGSASGPREREALAARPQAAWAATRALPLAFGLSPDEQTAWLRHMTEELTRLDLPSPRGPAQGLAPLVAPPRLSDALRLRQLAPMQRPLLLRAWLNAARDGHLLQRPAVADTLHLACVALRLPVPQDLGPVDAI